MHVKLKNLFSTKDFKNENYDWETLRDSIITYGYDTKKYEMISVITLYKGHYLILDGNHRFFILKEFYDDEYEIEVKSSGYFKITFLYLIIFIVLNIWYIYTKIFFIIKYHKNKLFIKKV
jgi:hypothetical protein